MTEEKKNPTLEDVEEGEAIWNQYIIDDGWWHYSAEPFSEYQEVHAVISDVDFGRICSYQNILVGLHIIFKAEDGFNVSWEFTDMPNLQILFKKAKTIDISELVGTPMLLAIKGHRIIGCKVNEVLVV